MSQSTIRQALGALKDQTTISLARVSSTLAPELDVAVVKATSHDADPADEKHAREILSLTSYSPAYVSVAIAAVSRRLSRTKNWIVALKTLVLVHRLLADGDPAFRHEIVGATRRGTRLLNLADFRDESSSNSWDMSAFVRAYALYLDYKLEFAVYEMKEDPRMYDFDDRNPKRNDSDPRFRSASGNFDRYDGRNGKSYGFDGKFRSTSGNFDRYGEDSMRNPKSYDFDYNRSKSRDFDKYSSGKGYGFGSDYNSEGFGMRSEDRAVVEKKPPTPAREMKPERALGRMRHLQQLLDRFLGCRPTGRAKSSRMVLVALYPVVRESFQLYADVCEMLAVLLDRFFDMEYPDCLKAFEAYARSAKQIDELVAFYGWCKDVGVARSSEYPEVQPITDKLLETLEEFLRDKNGKPKSPERLLVEDVKPPPPVEDEVVPEEDPNAIKALPAPEDFVEKPPEKDNDDKKQQQETGDLLDLRDETFTADEQGDRLALALFSGAELSNGNENGDSNVSSAWQNPAAESGKADWELVLVETASNLSKQKATLGGGFNPVMLNGMYDQGAVRQHVNAQVAGGSASSVALPALTRGGTPVLALPAPDGTVQTVGQDPFAASLSVPPPSYVQMSDIEKKQHLLVQEQQLWHQYAQNGMQGQVSLAKLSIGYNHVSPPMANGMPLPALHGGGYYHSPY